MDTDVRNNQMKRIVQFVEHFGSINPLQALNYLGVMRLAARISDLEKAGYVFEHKPAKGINKFGETIRYMEYRAVDDSWQNGLSSSMSRS